MVSSNSKTLCFCKTIRSSPCFEGKTLLNGKMNDMHNMTFSFCYKLKQLKNNRYKIYLNIILFYFFSRTMTCINIFSISHCRYCTFTGPALQEIHPDHYRMKLFTFPNEKAPFARTTVIHVPLPQHSLSLKDLTMLALYSRPLRKCEN